VDAREHMARIVAKTDHLYETCDKCWRWRMYLVMLRNVCYALMPLTSVIRRCIDFVSVAYRWIIKRSFKLLNQSDFPNLSRASLLLVTKIFVGFLSPTRKMLR